MHGREASELPPDALATVVATTTNTSWTDSNAVPATRNYRIKIPFFQP